MTAVIASGTVSDQHAGQQPRATMIAQSSIRSPKLRMAKSRGRIERRRQLARVPFVVECRIPGGGLRERLDAMHAWVRARCGNDGYATSKRVERGPDGMPADGLRVHFADAADAKTFAREFDLVHQPP